MISLHEPIPGASFWLCQAQFLGKYYLVRRVAGVRQLGTWLTAPTPEQGLLQIRFNEGWDQNKSGLCKQTHGCVAVSVVCFPLFI